MKIEMLTIDEVACKLGLHRGTVQQMAIAGRITGVKVGRDWRFRSDVIDEITKDGIPQIKKRSE